MNDPAPGDPVAEALEYLEGEDTDRAQELVARLQAHRNGWRETWLDSETILLHPREGATYRLQLDRGGRNGEPPLWSLTYEGAAFSDPDGMALEAAVPLWEAVRAAMEHQGGRT